MIELDGIGKVFPGVVALDGVSLSVKGGEIRALMGENGAGKSTLLKILSGQYRPDSGQLRVDDQTVVLDGPVAAQKAGIAIIHQELHLVPDMSVEENLLLGMYPGQGGFLDRKAMRTAAQGVLKRLGEDLDPRQRVRDLSMGKRQMIEIGKALLRNARIIAFDEPTSSLSARETEVLMGIIRDLKAEGRAIFYVSHRLEEVFALCDSVSILRDGKHVATHADLKAVSPDQLIAEMVGRSIEDVYNYQSRPLGETRIEALGVVGRGLRAPVSFAAKRGEILGFFGLVGAGRSELMKLLFGAETIVAGQVRIDGAPVHFRSPRDAIAKGLALISEDRKGEGIVPLFPVADNINLTKRNFGGTFVAEAVEKTTAAGLIERLRVRTASTATPIGTLSGGNQQKALLARWLAAEAEIFLLDEPTRGIDIGSRSEIYALMYALAAEGKTLIVVSSDLPEVMGVSDRIIVMREGAISGELSRDAATPEAILKRALPDASAA
ncbi:MAG TPA: L-arabinose ABC transporter ATP-binding protein AraG [Asticcacaulis sp.]|nr:L-arabinose ABC transporter ATP-binding protein AraG [Asticcacaulis sp.]